MKHKIYPLIIAILYISFSCSNKPKYNNCKTFSNNDLHKLEIKFLQGKSLIFNQEIQNPVRIQLLDSILILNNMNTGILLDKYNINTLNKIGSCIPFGSGPNEMLIINKIQQTDSTIWLFDQSQNKLFQFNISDFLTNQAPNPRKTISLEIASSSVIVLSPERIIATTLNPDGSRFTIFDGEGNIIKDISEYPDFGEEMTGYEKMVSFSVESVLSEDKQNIILTYKQTDLVEIYDIDGNLKTRVQGPDQLFTALKQKQDGEQIRVVPKDDNTFDAYFSPCTYKNEIFALYSGKAFNRKEANYLLDRIIVFNTLGDPIREYKLSEPIFQFTVDSKSKKIYGISDSPEFHIIEFPFE